MEKVCRDSLDILKLEERIREKMVELQRNSVSLTELQRSHTKTREQLFIRESELGAERRSSDDLRSRLKSASSLVNEHAALRFKESSRITGLVSENVLLTRERDSLMRETKVARVEAARFRRDLEEITGTYDAEARRTKELACEVDRLKKETERIAVVIDTSLAKLSQEQIRLATRCRGLATLNDRLRVFGLCQHATNRRNEREIERLREKIVALESRNVDWTTRERLEGEVEAMRAKFQETLKDLRSKLESPVEGTHKEK